MNADPCIIVVAGIEVTGPPVDPVIRSRNIALTAVRDGQEGKVRGAELTFAYPVDAEVFRLLHPELQFVDVSER